MLGPERSKGPLDHAPPPAPIFQMYESDGSLMVYWHALDSGDASPGNPQDQVEQGWRLGGFARAGGSAVSESCFYIQHRLCLPEELLPVFTSSVWVRGLNAGH